MLIQPLRSVIREPLWVARSLSRNNLLFVNREQRSLIRAVRPYTLLGVGRLRSLWRLANLVVHEGMPGTFVECGSYNGGSGALLAYVASRYGRATWLFDSFEGLPPPSAHDITFSGDRGDTGDFKGSKDKVRQVLREVGVSPSAVQIVPGWFQDTLPSSATGPVALLHIDADWYQSTRTVLEALYDRVVAGGVVVLDDYAFWQGHKRAVDEFLVERGERPVIHQSGFPSAWFRKTS